MNYLRIMEIYIVLNAEPQLRQLYQWLERELSAGLMVFNQVPGSVGVLSKLRTTK